MRRAWTTVSGSLARPSLRSERATESLADRGRGRYTPHMAANHLVLAMTGASGAPYGVRLLDVLLRAGRTVHLTISPSAVEVMQLELDRTVRLDRFDAADLLGDRVPDGPGQVVYHHYRDF